MSLRWISVGILACAIAFPLRAAAESTRHYRAGDRLFVHASTGLSLRKAPGLEGEKIGLLPYRQVVYALPDKRAPVAVRFENISGHWALVESEQGQGYIFDGFLSIYPVPAEGEGYRQWADRAFGKPISDKKTAESEGPEGMTRRMVRYPGGARYESEQEEPFYGYALVLPSGRLVDGFLVARGFHDPECLAASERFPKKTGGRFSASDKRIDVDCGERGAIGIKILEDGSIRINWGSAS
ncbi:MAG: SH3 domain-containing protein [Deltaproteobacteria bacterium]|nr:SH3 domain-containing protein [Deltaproteobacteria bacterium]